MTNALETAYLEIANKDVGDVSADFNPDNYELIPWKGRILVRRFPKDSMTKGGLQLPEKAQQTKNWGRIVRLPPDPPPGIKVGDIIVFIEGAGQPVEGLGKDLILLSYNDDFENDLVGILRKREVD
jgi:co-chaperonin GroES (HSP10)